MANRWLFAGGDIGMMRLLGSPATSTGASVNSSYADHSIIMTANTQGVYADFVDSVGASDSVTTGETVWVMGTVYSNSTTTAGNLIALLNGSDQPWLALRSTTSSTSFGLYYNSGTGGSPVWTIIGSTFTIALTTITYVVIKLTLGSPHSAEIFVDGVSKASGTFTQASLTAVDAVLYTSPGTTQRFTEMAAAVGINLVGAHVYYGKPSAVGNSSGWTGLFSTVDDVGIDDTDFATSGTAGQRTTWNYANHPADGLVAGDWFMWTRAKNDGAAPQNIKPVRRTGGADTVGSSFTGVGAGFTEFLTRYSGLTASDYDSSEFGVESAT